MCYCDLFITFAEINVNCDMEDKLKKYIKVIGWTILAIFLTLILLGIIGNIVYAIYVFTH